MMRGMADRISDNGNKDQNSNDCNKPNGCHVEVDDYEYKMANPTSAGEDVIVARRPSREAGGGSSTEIDDTTVGLMLSSSVEKWRDVVAGERKLDDNGSGSDERDLTMPGRFKRKLLSIEGEQQSDEVVGVNEGEVESAFDYDTDKSHQSLRSGLGGLEHFVEGNGDGDYLWHQGVSGGDDGTSGQTDSSDPADSNNMRRNVEQEMDRHPVSHVFDDGNRKRKSSESGWNDKKISVSQNSDKQTIYHQHYEHQSNAVCDCAQQCSKVEQNEVETATEMADVGPTEDEEIKTDQNNEVQESTDDQSQEDELQVEPTTTEQTEAEHDEQPSAYRKEVYIDLKIGFKNVNTSLDQQQDPIEFHKKIVIKRGSNPIDSIQEASFSPPFPVDLIEAIYQLVDQNDDLRRHVAPRLQDRSKVLSKVAELNQRRKINDRWPSLTGDDTRKAVQAVGPPNEEPVSSLAESAET
ncbi:uncharacterized protein LOC129748295 [Uranotaenia lowii]|uniref:uncharacterized protein LOC129748295 n=1 Tax=Uranotaenia lowii TaxID=190385 RepID=UPI0024796249|nr:uncharacterized protein LOC129748295 [Uranotaenia lowii]